MRSFDSTLKKRLHLTAVADSSDGFFSITLNVRTGLHRCCEYDRKTPKIIPVPLVIQFSDLFENIQPDTVGYLTVTIYHFGND